MQSRDDGMLSRAGEGLGHVHVTLSECYIVITATISFTSSLRRHEVR